MTDETPDYIGHRKRLKERFIKSDGRDMADYELIELILTLAIPRRDVKPIAKQLIKTFGDFAGVINATPSQLMEINGIKDSAVTVLKIIRAAAQRLSWQNLASDDMPVLLNIDSLIDFCRCTMAYSDVEELHIIYLDAKLKVIKTELTQRGSLTGVSASPRDIVKSAMENKAVSIIMVHNHPSGNTKPSENDKIITKKVAEACEIMGLRLQEHIIISKSSYFSFREHGLI